MSEEEIKYCKFCDNNKPIKQFCKSGFAIKNICKECHNKKQYQIRKQAKEVEKLQKENSQLKERIEKAQKLIEVPTYPENIYLGFCYLFGKYDYDELPSRIKEALK